MIQDKQIKTLIAWFKKYSVVGDKINGIIENNHVNLINDLNTYHDNYIIINISGANKLNILYMYNEEKNRWEQRI